MGRRSGDSIVMLNLANGSVVKQAESSAPIVKLKMNSMGTIACGLENGLVNVRNSSLQIIHTLPAHVMICDLDISDTLLITIGYAKKRGELYMENLVKLWDVKTWKQLPSLPTTMAPKFCCILPGQQSAIIATQNGSFYDWNCSTDTPQTYTLPPIFPTAMDVSSNAQHMALVDHAGFLYMYSRSQLPFNNTTRELEGVYPLQYTSIDQNMPLSTVGMPHYSEPLLSATQWPLHVNTRRIKIPPEILASAVCKPNDVVAYARNPGNLKRNQFTSSLIDTPKFRSQTAAPIASTSSQSTIPAPWKSVEIKYSRFGVEDFDFAFYNKTQFGGLEGHIDHSYCNSYLQLLYFTPPLRLICKSHIRMSCYREFCLACELGFLFCMLDDAKGMNCQASNFLKSFAKKPQAQALGLLDHGVNPKYAEMIQGFTRFILDHVSMELNTCKPEPLKIQAVEGVEGSVVQQLYGLEMIIATKCQVCQSVTTKPSFPLVLDLIKNRKPFADVLRASLARETWTRGWCAKCNNYTSISSQRKLQRLPPIFSINCGESDVLREGGVSTELQLDIDNGAIVVGRGRDYQLLGMVMMIEEKKGHLVTCVKQDGEWFVFNDFAVQSLPEAEVFAAVNWKQVCNLTYVAKNVNDSINLDALPSGNDYSILVHDPTAINRKRHLENLVGLTMDEAMSMHGKILAIDSEFVALTRDETELRSDGTRVVVRPSRLGLARVSVIHGEGPSKGKAFIDDWILLGENVMDYLTEFSGIKPGDLDPGISNHTLVPLKSAYKKLRLLVDMKCRFVGHGLLKDFRIINILVPPDQVIDTVNLYYIPQRQRRVGLRFLAWFLCKRDIQTSGHDSVEDAKMALELWERYQEMEKDGSLVKVLESIYDQGKLLSWKPTSG